MAVTPLPDASDGQPRHGEVIKAYHVGAYADPANPRVRHEPHVIHRVESDAAWNVRPVVTSGPAQARADSAQVSRMLAADVETELNRQRDATRKLQQQSEDMTKRLETIQQMVADIPKTPAQPPPPSSVQPSNSANPVLP
jgi:hypothetical protein